MNRRTKKEENRKDLPLKKVSWQKGKEPIVRQILLFPMGTVRSGLLVSYVRPMADTKGATPFPKGLSSSIRIKAYECTKLHLKL